MSKRFNAKKYFNIFNIAAIVLHVFAKKSLKTDVVLCVVQIVSIGSFLFPEGRCREDQDVGHHRPPHQASRDRRKPIKDTRTRSTVCP